MHELGGLYCKTVVSGIIAKYQALKKNTCGPKQRPAQEEQGSGGESSHRALARLEAVGPWEAGFNASGGPRPMVSCLPAPTTVGLAPDSARHVFFFQRLNFSYYS